MIISPRTGLTSIFGGLLKPTNPAFLATLSGNATAVTGDGTTYTMICDTERLDRGGGYIHTTGIHEVEATGLYAYVAWVSLSNFNSGHTSFFLNLVTTARTYSMTNADILPDVGGRGIIHGVLFPVPMTAGNTAKINVSVGGGAKVVDLLAADRTYFGGMQVG